MKDENYHKNSIRLSVVRESIGGCCAIDSNMFNEAVCSLLSLGWTEEQISEEYKKQVDSIYG